MPRLFFIFIISVFSVSAFAQTDFTNNVAADYKTDSLNNIYGKHKHLLKEYELPSLIALSYFPELIDESIKFKFSSINSTARTTVTFFSVFKNIHKQYIIYINANKEKTGMLLSQAPFDAQVALIAHELAHVIDFKKRSFLGMAWWGASYLFIKQRTKIEKRADEMVIERGLGLQLYHWADFVLNHSTANKHYLKMKENKYLSPDEILTNMKKNNK